jgi:hypothetical protein
MTVVRLEYCDAGFLRPRFAEAVYQPRRVSGASRQPLIDTTEQYAALSHEPAQDGIYQAARPMLLKDARRVDGSVDRGLGSIARILDLMRARDEQGVQLIGYAFWSRQQHVDSGREPQVPARTAERDGTDRSSLGRRIEGR